MERLHRGWLMRLAIGLAIVASVALVGSTRSAAGATPQKGAYQVAILSPGTSNDGSWGQDVGLGAQGASKYGAKVVFVDNLTTPAQYEQQGSAFAGKHYQLVILANYSDQDVIVKLGKQFPGTWFCELTTALQNLPKNVCTLNLLFQDGDFVAGALGGMITKTNKVGTIGGFNFPALNSEMEGFILGARWINHSIKGLETFINSWTDVAAARAAATAQIGAGADIVFSATDQATQGIYATAQAHPHTYVISQYFDTHSQAPKVALTSVLFNLHGAVAELIRLGATGKLHSKNYVFGPKNHVGVLAPFYNLQSVIPAAVQQRLKKIEAMLRNGTLRAPFLAVSGSAAKYNLSKLPAPPK